MCAATRKTISTSNNQWRWLRSSANKDDRTQEQIEILKMDWTLTVVDHSADDPLAAALICWGSNITERSLVMTQKSKEQIPENMKLVYESIVRFTDEFCERHLDQEYAELSRKLAAALARKRPSPLMSGAVETWACGIIYTLGKVNFLFDKSQTPHMRGDEICALFGVGKSTGPAKAKTIMSLLKIGLMDAKWYRPSKLADNPMAWMIQVNGLIVDARSMPREIQEEAFRRGLIPYLPLWE